MPRIWKVEWDHGGLLEFYTRAYRLVRAASPTALAVFNVLYSADFPGGCERIPSPDREP